MQTTPQKAPTSTKKQCFRRLALALLAAIGLRSKGPLIPGPHDTSEAPTSDCEKISSAPMQQQLSPHRKKCSGL